MRTLTEFSWADVLGLQDDIRAALKVSTCLEEAAQRATEIIYGALAESALLVRVFATVPLSSLPADIHGRVKGLARTQQIDGSLRGESLILTLLGSAGAKREWNDRRDSVAHAGIPLISAAFVGAIPMVARLLNELGVDLQWFDHSDTSFVEKKLAAGLAGLFYVRDAATGLDAQGRQIIPAQDFVGEHGVKTVFGIGGVYAYGTILTLVVFTREFIEKEQVEQLIPLIPCFKAATAALVQNGQLFC